MKWRISVHFWHFFTAVFSHVALLLTYGNSLMWFWLTGLCAGRSVLWSQSINQSINQNTIIYHQFVMSRANQRHIESLRRFNVVSTTLVVTRIELGYIQQSLHLSTFPSIQCKSIIEQQKIIANTNIVCLQLAETLYHCKFQLSLHHVNLIIWWLRWWWWWWWKQAAQTRHFLCRSRADVINQNVKLSQDHVQVRVIKSLGCQHKCKVCYERWQATKYKVAYLPCAFRHGSTFWVDSSDTDYACPCRRCSCAEIDTCTRGSCVQNDERSLCSHRTTPRRSACQ